MINLNIIPHSSRIETSTDLQTGPGLIIVNREDPSYFSVSQHITALPTHNSAEY